MRRLPRISSGVFQLLERAYDKSEKRKNDCGCIGHSSGRRCVGCLHERNVHDAASRPPVANRRHRCRRRNRHTSEVIAPPARKIQRGGPDRKRHLQSAAEVRLEMDACGWIADLGQGPACANEAYPASSFRSYRDVEQSVNGNEGVFYRQLAH